MLASLPFSASRSASPGCCWGRRSHLSGLLESRVRYTRAPTKNEGRIAATHRASEGETTVGALPLAAACTLILAATCALPTSTYCDGSNPESRSRQQDAPAVVVEQRAVDRSLMLNRRASIGAPVAA